MKTKGNWVIKTSAGGYWCGSWHFDPQLRKAQIYHWKEKAEEQLEHLKQRGWLSEDITYEVVPVLEPKELKDIEARWLDIDEYSYTCSNCGGYSLNDFSGKSIRSKFCPNCGKLMINGTL